MKKYSITKTVTPIRVLLNAFFVFMGSMFFFAILLGAMDDPGESIVWCSVMSTVVISVFVSLLHKNDLKHHAQKSEEYAKSRGFSYIPEMSIASSALTQASVFDLRGVRHPETSNIIEAPGWIYADLTYRIYKKTKYGEYHAHTIYYSVLCMDLPRNLPNVFFDSKHARKRQFRFHFSSKQLLSFEGNFDDHFVTYCPEGYEIDSLSFLSPDVLQAILAAKDYDIEIKNDKLHLYDSLRDPTAQIDRMVDTLSSIRDQLLDNILTYRDERLAVSEGRKSVSISGISLKKSRFWTIVEIVIPILLLLFFFATNIAPKILD